jgi:hypothetical protein
VRRLVLCAAILGLGQKGFAAGNKKYLQYESSPRQTGSMIYATGCAKPDLSFFNAHAASEERARQAIISFYCSQKPGKIFANVCTDVFYGPAENPVHCVQIKVAAKDVLCR